VGIVSQSMGSLRFGRQDIYYGITGSVLPSSVHINASAPSVIHNPGAIKNSAYTISQVSMASHSRTPNLIWYTSPTIQGWSATAAFSTQPLAASGTNQTENDLSTTSATRKGSGTYFQVNGKVGPVDLAAATVNLKSDYFGGKCSLVGDVCVQEWTNQAQPNQKGNVVSAIYRSGPVALGAAYSVNKSSSNAEPSLTTERSAFNLSAAYTMGKHTLGIERQTASDLTVRNVKQGDTGMTGTTLAWDYAFSKRTNVGITYFTLENDTFSNTGPFYSGSNTFGGQFGAQPGEKYTLTSFVMPHTW